ncbi:peptidoglycan-binding protein LysM [Ampullimonas aquatilis]|uniref:peptidoglycan-binding protein LysM n=1 Tax=Ampullimonas aquatilis TaxID=1341549 RepID=UPI003C707E61
MGLLSFIKEAGEKLFGHGEAQAAEPSAADAANQAAGAAIVDYIHKMGLDADGLAVTVDGAVGAVTVAGLADTQEIREKIILCCGNVHGVASVDDQLTVKAPTQEATWHTVEKGDTLWAVAEKAYGKGSEYNRIFEANRPMLSHPDKIYPGQKLRIPA